MHKETSTGYTAIHIAALSGHVNCLKVMTDKVQLVHGSLTIFSLVASCFRL